jgi:hypothetical protein
VRPSLPLVVPVVDEQARFAELRLVGAGRLSLPAGTSILCVAGKASGGDQA